MEHTPKNILIRAVKKENKRFTDEDKKALDSLLEEIAVEPMLVKLFKQ